MRTFAFSFLTLVISLGFMSCEKEDLQIDPSSRISTLERPVNGFNNLNISDPFEVFVEFSDREELLIEANDNLHHVVNVKERNGTLFIELENNVRIRGNYTLKALVKTRNLEKLTAAGATRIYLENTWENNDPQIELTGACHMSGEVIADDFRVELDGASTLQLTGSAREFEVNAEGACHMTGFDFVTDHLDADLTGASTMKLTVNESLSVTATGASTVEYKGNGRVDYQNLSGGSQIIKR